MTDLTEGAVSIVELEYIAHVLVVVTVSYISPESLRIHALHLGFLPVVVCGHHITDHDIQPAVIVKIRQVDAHAEK